jgi:glycogen operon protein
MLLAGDELGRTQQGNNNAYCQDNEISWVDWDDQDEAFFEFARKILKLRAEHPAFRRRRFFDGEAIAWFTPAGDQMTGEDWDAGFAKSLAVYLNGDAITEQGRHGEPIRDDSFLLLINASEIDLEFTVVPAEYGDRWHKVLDTTDRYFSDRDTPPVKPGEKVTVTSRSLQLLCRGD